MLAAFCTPGKAFLLQSTPKPMPIRPPAHAPQGDVQCRELAVKARAASRQLQALRSEDRVAILNRIADSLESHEQEIMAENAVDVEAAATGKVGDALLQRLVLKPTKIHQLAGAWMLVGWMDGALLHAAGKPAATASKGAPAARRQPCAFAPRWRLGAWLHTLLASLCCSALLQTASARLPSRRSRWGAC